MDFVSIRIITDDVARLAGFYERATGVPAAWPNENFAELTTGSATLAIASTATVPLFAPGAARPADSHLPGRNRPNRRRIRAGRASPPSLFTMSLLRTARRPVSVTPLGGLLIPATWA
jgi:hypothetical protein